MDVGEQQGTEGGNSQLLPDLQVQVEVLHS
jgi:hypothetical protein